VPLEGETVVQDLVRGPIVFQNALQNDAVMLKSDGFPTYHFAVVVDDHLMKITHAMRGDEWIATSPLHVLLYQFFGWEQPVWVHLPNVLGPDGKKYSKRHGATAVNEFIEKGYLVEALTNCLALVGWGYDETTEIMTRDELIERFDITRISASGGVLNIEKLNKFNGIYIRQLSPAELTDRILPYLQRAGIVGDPPTDAERARIEELVPLIQERLVLLGEAPDLLRLFFDRPEQYDHALLVPKKLDPPTTRNALVAAAEMLSGLDVWTVPTLEAKIRSLTEELGLKVGDFFMALRVATTGSKVSPPLFETLHALGRDETLARLENAIRSLGSD
jgi:glutamyl-tRNA synthetase